MNREEMLALADRAEGCLNSRNNAYPSDVLRECIAALRSPSPASGEACPRCAANADHARLANANQKAMARALKAKSAECDALRATPSPSAHGAEVVAWREQDAHWVIKMSWEDDGKPCSCQMEGSGSLATVKALVRKHAAAFGWRPEFGSKFQIGSYDWPNYVAVSPGNIDTISQPGIELREAWLRWGLEEIVRCTEPRAGNGDTFICRIANEALISAGFDITMAGIQKPLTKATEGAVTPP